jgi:hypothetical protein
MNRNSILKYCLDELYVARNQDSSVSIVILYKLFQKGDGGSISSRGRNDSHTRIVQTCPAIQWIGRLISGAKAAAVTSI